jgi:uncharacterized membrane protein YedE/YeeE
MNRDRLAWLSAFAAGLLFGIGLIVSGMANPAKVLAFLDLAKPWDPSLALVMIGAIGVGSIAFALAAGRRKSLLGLAMRLPPSTGIPLRLVGGAAVFGIGWGLAGFCPGPALVVLATGQPKAAVFVAAMLAGMIVFEAVERLRAARRDRAIA